MSSDYYAYQAGEIADRGGYPCCEHCDHDPGYTHPDPCFTCEES